MTEKQFKVEVSSDNYVHFSENGVNVISIGFKEYADAESCKYALLPFCNRLNELSNQNNEIKTILTQLVNQLYNSQLSLIHEYSTDIANDEKELKKYFQDQYGKYGWKK